MHVNDFKLIVDNHNESVEIIKQIAFKDAQLKIMTFINSHRRPLDKGGTYYRLSVEDIINYIEKMEYKS